MDARRPTPASSERRGARRAARPWCACCRTCRRREPEPAELCRAAVCLYYSKSARLKTRVPCLNGATTVYASYCSLPSPFSAREGRSHGTFAALGSRPQLAVSPRRRAQSRPLFRAAIEAHASDNDAYDADEEDKGVGPVVESQGANAAGARGPAMPRGCRALAALGSEIAWETQFLFRNRTADTQR